MKVLFAAPVFPLPRDGGAKIRLMRHIEVLSARHEVRVVTIVRGDENPELLEELRSFGELDAVRAPHRRSLLHRIAYRFIYPVQGLLRDWPPDAFYGCPVPFAATVRQRAVEWGSDIVHYDYWFSGLQDLHAQPYHRVLLEHDVEYVRRRRDYEKTRAPRLQKLWLNTERLETEVLRCMDAVLTVTDRDSEEALTAGAHKAIKLPTGVDTDAWKPPAAEPEEENVVFVGAFSHKPNVDSMLWYFNEILPLVLKRHPQAHLWIVGSGPPPEITALHAHPNVTVTGRVPEVTPYFEQARVVIAPLRIGSGIKGKIIEGMAFGRPVVTTSIGAEGMDLTPGENIILADGAADFADAVCKALEDPAASRAIGRKAREFVVQRHSQKQADARILEIYERDVWAESHDTAGSPGGVHQ